MAIPMILLAIMAASFPAASAEHSECTISFELLNKEIWTLKVGPERIVGDQNTLERKDDVVSGFVDGKHTRLHFSKKSIGGKLAGKDVQLVLSRDPEHVEIHGAEGRSRLSVSASDNQMVLSNNKITLSLKKSSSSKDGQVLANKRGTINLLFRGCGLGIVRQRPEILLILKQVLLKRAQEFEDIPDK